MNDRPFTLRPADHSRFGAKLQETIARPLDWLLGLDRLNQTYAHCAGLTDPADFLTRALDDLRVGHRVSDHDLARIPKRGPVVVVANHPFGALDGMVLASVLLRARPDVKVMANYMLGRVRELRNLFLFVDPFGGEGSATKNVNPMRQSIRWLQQNGVLAAFPAGEVAHLDLRGRRIVDPLWNPIIARIIRRTGATVLPIYFDGSNGPLFHLAGLLHPRLRTALLPRELIRKRDTQIDLRIGTPINPTRLAEFEGDDELNAYLRRRVFLLQHRGSEQAPAEVETPAELEPETKAPKTVLPSASTGEPIIAPVEPALLADDVAKLAPEQILVEHEEFIVAAARAPQIRNVLRELGRLREISFRAAGEGTGQSIDLDTFDYDYLHLFVWNRVTRELVGGYRLGHSDELLAAKGRLGLYTSTLFNFDAEFLRRRLCPALELGRSFVRLEYQRSYAPLLLLWRGIGTYCVRNPKYRLLFGPVSISNSYQPVSKKLMVDFLSSHHSEPSSRGFVEPHHPFNASPIRGWDEREEMKKSRTVKLPTPNRLSLLSDDANEVSSLVADLEPDQKGLPVLIRQYLRLGAKFLSFNIDPKFSDALDGLIVVDLDQTEPRVLERYMGKEGFKEFKSAARVVAN